MKQVNVHWHEALSVYFEPEGFRIAMQNCITTARSVTFVLQHHKSVIPRFDEWYAPWQSRFAGNPIMRWAVQARNKIEKQGDLETLSQMRAELIAAYDGEEGRRGRGQLARRSRAGRVSPALSRPRLYRRQLAFRPPQL
ncbi:MAG: hypothetical protein ABSD08_12755 [Xanthobacteraceae bacterium]